MPKRAKCEEPIFNERELSIIRLLAEGKTNVEIGAELGYSPETIKSYLKEIFRKLSTNKRALAAVKAIEMGLVNS